MGRGAESWKGSGELTRVTGKGELGAACGSSPELRLPSAAQRRSVFPHVRCAGRQETERGSSVPPMDVLGS
ncbi:unnamed protein product [Lampetra fluviatilis]